MVTKPLKSSSKGACRICNRKLKSTKSIITGFGPICARKFPALIRFEENEKQGQMRFPFFNQGDKQHDSQRDLAEGPS